MENPNFLEPASQPQGNIHKFHGTLILAVALASLIGYFALASQLPLWPFEMPLSFVVATPQPNQRACTQEAKLCPDGTAVGRTGPNCEFSKCPGEVDVSNWKTYTNDQYGFEFRYPAYFAEQEITWQSKDALAMLVDTKESSDYSGFIKVGIADGKIDKSEFNSTGYLTNPDLILYNKKNNIKFPAPVEEIINSIRWYKFIGEEIGDCFASYYQIEHNNKIIELAFTACEYYPQAFLNRDFKLQNQILSTFKFIEPTTNTSTWKTYTNTEYGFEFKYPGDEFTGDGVLNGESNGVDGFFLESGMALDVISILPKGEFDYGISKEADYVKEITFSGKLAKESFWNDLGGQTLKIINITESISNWSSNNRIEIRSSNKKELLDQILSTFRFTR